jgi:hypothetical protein
MRTTLTLDDDVGAALERLCDKQKRPFRTVVNDTLRAGIAVVTQKRSRPARLFRTKPVTLGKPRLPNVDDVAEVLAFLDHQAWR